MSKPIIDIMNQKFILELNAALAMENAAFNSKMNFWFIISIIGLDIINC